VYKLHLILKYLLRRRIAWVSLVAVMLCTTMVVVVRSVMGGWLQMFRQSFHGLSGDIIVEGHTLTGFPYYAEIIERIEKLKEVDSAIPTISAYGLINIDNQTSDGVLIFGYPLERVGRINEFPHSLYRQYKSLTDEANAKGTPPARAAILRKMAELPPNFDLRTYVRVPLDKLPQGVVLPGDESAPVAYDTKDKWLIARGAMDISRRDELIAAGSADPTFQEAIRVLYDKSLTDLIDYRTERHRSRSDVTKWPGMIAGIGVLEIRKGNTGKLEGRESYKFRLPARLTVIDMKPGSASVDMSSAAPKSFWIVDDSQTGVWQIDAKAVYVSFDVLQGMLGMDEKESLDKETGQKTSEPARCSDIQVKVKPSVDLQVAKGKIREIVDDVFAKHSADGVYMGRVPKVETWEEDKAEYIAAIENETVLVTFLFGIISVVAVFLIFCIFYMIVVEKTKDIGIIKSVGATAQGVAGIFLGYGLAIGLVGGAMGLLMSWLIVRNINYLHTKLAEVMGIQIWNPKVYLFDKIPNELIPRDVAVITGAMVIASVLGALIPALVAASKRPVDALRWE
jgi:lipoprotein-releasing system permease protein